MPKTGPIKPIVIDSATQDNKALIIATFSGGGSRAAAMCWRTLEVLKNTPYHYTNKAGYTIKSNLADQIDYISGISGGSFAATGWCLYKDSMEVFRKKFVEKNIQRELIKSLFIPPVTIFKLASPYYNRINSSSEYYDEHVFNKATFKDLPSYPKLWVNSTHLALGLRFTYTQEFFDWLNSDLSSYPVGYACAASSAFPILLDPITLKNYTKAVPDSVLMKDVKFRMAKKNSRNSIEKAFYCKRIEFFNDSKNKWNHMADGGLVDNQGLQVVLDEFGTNGVINKKLNDSQNPLKRLIIINVNAGTEAEDKSCRKQSPPHVPSVIEYTMVISMDRLSGKRWEQIKEMRNTVWKAALDLKGTSANYSNLEKPYCIEINFRNIKDDAVRDECNKLPTSFKLKKKEITLIDSIVPILIEEDPDMIRLKNELKKDIW